MAAITFCIFSGQLIADFTVFPQLLKQTDADCNWNFNQNGKTKISTPCHELLPYFNHSLKIVVNCLLPLSNILVPCGLIWCIQACYVACHLKASISLKLLHDSPLHLNDLLGHGNMSRWALTHIKLLSFLDAWIEFRGSSRDLASHADVLRSSSRVRVRGAATRDEPLRTSAWEASRDCQLTYSKGNTDNR